MSWHKKNNKKNIYTKTVQRRMHLKLLLRGS